MTTAVESLLTIGQLAQQLGQPTHRVTYIINSRGIEPVRRAGVIRLFDAGVLDRVQGEMDLIAARRGSGKAKDNDNDL